MNIMSNDYLVTINRLSLSVTRHVVVEDRNDELDVVY
jgi:hypothetical protein